MGIWFLYVTASSRLLNNSESELHNLQDFENISESKKHQLRVFQKPQRTVSWRELARKSTGSFLVCHLIFFKCSENHGYILEVGIWFFWEPQLWALRTTTLISSGGGFWCGFQHPPNIANFLPGMWELDLGLSISPRLDFLNKWRSVRNGSPKKMVSIVKLPARFSTEQNFQQTFLS